MKKKWVDQLVRLVQSLKKAELTPRISRTSPFIIDISSNSWINLIVSYYYCIIRETRKIKVWIVDD